MAEQGLPLVSFMMLTYNQEAFIAEAVHGALSQDYSPLEIVISDDASTDGTFAAIEREVAAYAGPHKVLVRRNARNMGLARHFSSVAGMCNGDVVVGAAGDDVSLPDRVARTARILAEHPDAMFVSFSDVCIDRNGLEVPSRKRARTGALAKITLRDYLAGRSPSISGASRAYRRRIFDVFGDLNPACPTEDTPHLLRGLMLGDGLVSGSPGIRYRIHDSNLSRIDSLARMPLVEIRDQYLTDLGVAKSSGLVSPQAAARVERWIETTFLRRRIESEIYRARRPFVAVARAMAAPGLGPLQKAAMARRFLRHAMGRR